MTNPIDITQKYFVRNDEVLDLKSFNYTHFQCPKIIYEVIKVIDNSPLFYTEHLERLVRSCSIAKLVCPSKEEITHGVKMLIAKNPVELKNLRISLCFSNPNTPLFLCYFVDSHYPLPIDYADGVRIEVLQLVRNLPNVKADNPTLRNAADKIIQTQRVYETLLVDEIGYITECSRSNFFAVLGNQLVTPPAKDVLEGVTRLKVMELANKNGVECIERRMKLEELPSFDGAFITGTSRGVLPLNAVGEIKYVSRNKVTKKLIELYNNEVDRDVKQWGNQNR